MKKFNLVVLVLIISLNVYSQIPISSLLSKVPEQQLPFNGSKNQTFLRNQNYAVSSDGISCDRIYSNIQLTQYTTITNDGENGYEFFRKFAIPNSSNKLLALCLGGVTDMNVMILVVVSPNGNILGQIESEAMYYPYIAIMQYRITTNAQIIISKLVPTSTSSISLTNFTSFEAKRVDKTYSITPAGQFQELSSVAYKPQIYTRSQLSNKSYNIWQGNEVPE